MSQLKFIFVALILTFSSTSHADSPNIVFVLADDLGWGDLGVFYQNQSDHSQVLRTPNLDRLGLSGLQMRAHYCPAPVCAPSRSSLLTGVHQGNAVVRDNQFDEELEDNHTIGTVLQSAGYRTCMIGKYGLQGGPKDKQQFGSPEDWPAYPTKRGFDEFFGYVSHYSGHLHYPNDPWALANEQHSDVPNLWHSDESGDHEISESLSKCYTTDLFTARAKHFLTTHRQQRGDQPFFLMLNYDTPHAALQVPAVAYPRGGGIDGGLRWTGGTDPDSIELPAINTAVGEVDSYLHPDYADQDWVDVDKRFATMVRRIDSAVGDLNETLEELGMAENTLVVFTSDNGPHQEAYLKGEGWESDSYSPQAFQSYGPYDGTKRDCWEGGIRMPTLAWWKGRIDANRIDSTPSQFHDWMATFCDIADIPAPARCDGVSLMPTLARSGQQSPSTVYVEYVNESKTPGYSDFSATHQQRERKQMQVIRLAGRDGVLYKGVRYDIQSAQDDFEIYNVESDAEEAKNLAGTSAAMQQLQKEMKAKVLQIRYPIETAKRPYDHALVPAIEIPAADEALARFRIRRTDLPTGVNYVSTMASDAQAITASIATDAVKQAYTFVAPAAGLYEIKGGVTVSQDGQYTIQADSDSACFMRLHESHAIDIRQRDGGQASSSKRSLSRGWHPVTLLVRVEKAGAKVTWTVQQSGP